MCCYADERWDLLQEAVRSLAAQELPPAEVIVVVDHNPPLERRVREAWPDLVVLPNAGRRGLSGARNTAVAAARAPVIAFLDDDAAAAPDWIARIADAMSAPGMLGAGGTITPVWDGGRPRWFPEEFDWVVGCTYRGLPTRREPVRNLIGAGMALDARSVRAAGGFDTGLGRVGARPVGCEETELCIRVADVRPDGHIVFDPAIRVRHHVPRSRAGLRYFLARCHAEGLSKAGVAARVGPRRGLSTERRYATRTLPAGVVRSLRDALGGRDPWGAARAGAIILGLGATAAGYAPARLRRRRPGG